MRSRFVAVFYCISLLQAALSFAPWPVVLAFKSPATATPSSARPREAQPRSLRWRRAESKRQLESEGSSREGDDRNSFQNIVAVVGKSTSAVVAGTFFVALSWKRDAIMFTFFGGAILNSILSKILKKIINQSRPEAATDLTVRPGDGGMPSSHAMALGFIGTFVGFWLPWSRFPVAIYAALSLAYRVQVKLHTVEQILVGSALGTINGATWYHLCTGNNRWEYNVCELIGPLLNADGKLPVVTLLIPMVIGAATVGSVERRISRWIRQ